MFCTQCGTQVDEGKNFCKNCGAKVGRNSAPSEVAESAPAAVSREEETPVHAQPIITSTPHAPSAPAIREGKSNKTVLLAAGVAVIVLAGAGIFFASGLFKAKEESSLPPPPVQEPVAKAPSEDAPLPSFEESKVPPPGDTPLAAANPPLSPEPPPIVEPSKPAPVENVRKTAPASEPLPPATKSPLQRGSQDSTKTRPLPASRGGANPGTYETIRSATVYEDPSASARVLANIPAGVRVNVVGSTGDWLEVHSKRGNPPGFIRRGDATFVEPAN